VVALCVGAAGAFACRKDEPLGCTAEVVIPLPSSPLTDMKDVRMHRAGDDFVLVGVEGDTVRWNRVSEVGVPAAGGETTLTLPARAVGPWLAFTGKAAPGDQLAVVIGVKRPPKAAGQAEYVELQVITQDAGGAAAPAKTLLELPPVPGAEMSLRVSMGTARSGRRAGLAWGFEGQRVAPRFLVLKPDGEINGTPLDLTGAGTRWDCLTVVPSRTGLGVSTVGRAATQPGPVSWHLIELNDDSSGTGGSPASHSVMFSDVTEMDCPVVAPILPGTKTPKGGYAIAWQNADGTYFAEYLEKEIPDGGTMGTVNKDIVKGAVRFGGPTKQPKVACIAPVGKDFAITFEATTGPQVNRFDVFGNPVGSTLHLPVDGTPGPVSAWPGRDAFFETYLDLPRLGAGAPPSARRRLFLKSTCNATL
jgi:hypothetical protein